MRAAYSHSEVHNDLSLRIRAANSHSELPEPDCRIGTDTHMDIALPLPFLPALDYAVLRPEDARWCQQLLILTIPIGQ